LAFPAPEAAEVWVVGDGGADLVVPGGDRLQLVVEVEGAVEEFAGDFLVAAAGV
jgi:hypothetical protein